MSSVLRIIDANANRAREAIRLMEEAARFVLEDADLSAALKRLRHDLAAALQTLDPLDAHRDTPGDVGTHISTPAELRRSNVAQVANAAGKRLSEALRAIEEYAKTLGEPAWRIASTVESLRYRGYDVEQRLNRAMAGAAARQWRLCVLLTESLCAPRRWLEVLDAAIEAGADCIQLREKQLEDAALLERACTVVQRCRSRAVSVIINDRPDIAQLSGADGVHLGQGDLPCAEVRRVVGRQLLIGVSTSCIAQTQQALGDGADYCGVGPMFQTTTKHKEVIVGPAYLKSYVAWGKLPHLAIGGISLANIDQLIEAGCRGVAVSGAVCGADDPGRVVDDLLEKPAWHVGPARCRASS